MFESCIRNILEHIVPGIIHLDTIAEVERSPYAAGDRIIFRLEYTGDLTRQEDQMYVMRFLRSIETDDKYDWFGVGTALALNCNFESKKNFIFYGRKK